MFYSIAVEMKVLEARTDATGVKASKKHSATCKCIVCRIRKEKKNAEDPSKVTWKDAVKTMKEGGNAAEAQTAASDPTANGRHRDEEDDDAGGEVLPEAGFHGVLVRAAEMAHAAVSCWRHRSDSRFHLTPSVNLVDAGDTER